MTPTLKPLTYRDRKFVDALFECPNRSGRRKGNAAMPSRTVGLSVPAGQQELQLPTGVVSAAELDCEVARRSSREPLPRDRTGG